MTSRVAHRPSETLATRLRAFCEAMTELRHRPLFHALSRRTWELREELDLLERLASVKAGEKLPPPRHLPWRDGCPSPALARPADARAMSDCIIRPARPGDEPGAYYVCLKTGNHGEDGEPLYADDPDALGRIFVGPYLAFEPELSLMLEDDQRASAAMRWARWIRAPSTPATRAEWRPRLCAQFPAPQRGSAALDAGPAASTMCITTRITSARSRTMRIRRTCTSTCCRARRDAGYGRRMIEQVMDNAALARIAGRAPRRQRAECARARVLRAPRLSRIDPHRVRRVRVHLHGDDAQPLTMPRSRSSAEHRSARDPSRRGRCSERTEEDAPAPRASQRPLGASGRDGGRPNSSSDSPRCTAAVTASRS